MSADERRTEIMLSLVNILRERHIASLTMQDIADKLGMTKGNLYYYFRSKQDILFQCHLKAMEDSHRLIDQVERTGGTPGSRLNALIQCLIGSVTEHPYGAILVTDVQHLSPRQRRRYIALRDHVDLCVRRLIAAGIAAGEFPPTDVKVAGLAILGAVNSVSKWYDPGGPRTSAEIAAIFAEILVRGLRP